MPVDPNAAVEITAFNRVPPFAQGLVRDLRLRWAFEEIGLPYRTRLMDGMSPRPEGYVREQPFEQVPTYSEGDVHLFESGAILLHIAEKDERLMPRDPAGRGRTITWLFSALNSVEPAIMNLVTIDVFAAGEEWAKLGRPRAEDVVRQKLGRLSVWLGERDYLEERFTAADLLMVTVLRNLRHTKLVEEFPNLAAWKARCEARPAFQRALDAQCADFKELEAA